jgi:Glycerophosphoryl diester phosphodiesterase family
MFDRIAPPAKFAALLVLLGLLSPAAATVDAASADAPSADTTAPTPLTRVHAHNDSDELADLVPVISENWRTFFKWRGKGPLPADEREKLQSFVNKAHAHGRRIRFWNAPDNLAAWQELYAANVDLINTDDLPGAARFLHGVKP